MPTIIRLVLPMVLVVCVAEARAEGPDPAPARTPTSAPAVSTDASTGYRHQVVIADGLAYGQIAGAYFAQGPSGADTVASDLFLATGLGTYLVGAPAVHVAHGRWGRGLLSLGANPVGPR